MSSLSPSSSPYPTPKSFKIGALQTRIVAIEASRFDTAQKSSRTAGLRQRRAKRAAGAPLSAGGGICLRHLRKGFCNALTTSFLKLRERFCQEILFFFLMGAGCWEMRCIFRVPCVQIHSRLPSKITAVFARLQVLHSFHWNFWATEMLEYDLYYLAKDTQETPLQN